MKIEVGSAKVMLVENKGRGMSAESYANRLDAVLNMINNGSIGGGIGYGCDEHKDALVQIEEKIKEVRNNIEVVDMLNEYGDEDHQIKVIEDHGDVYAEHF